MIARRLLAGEPPAVAMAATNADFGHKTLMKVWDGAEREKENASRKAAQDQRIAQSTDPRKLRVTKDTVQLTAGYCCQCAGSNCLNQNGGSGCFKQQLGLCPQGTCGAGKEQDPHGVSCDTFDANLNTCPLCMLTLFMPNHAAEGWRHGLRV